MIFHMQSQDSVTGGDGEDDFKQAAGMMQIRSY